MLPIELACYALEEEISRAIVPLVQKYFSVETENPQKVSCRIHLPNYVSFVIINTNAYVRTFRFIGLVFGCQK